MKSYVASHLKNMNRNTVYRMLVSEECMSKAEIARRSGISKPTVLKIIESFTESGIVTEVGEGESELGRKPLLLKLNPQAAYAVGVEYDVDLLKIGIVDLLGGVVIIRQIECSLSFERLLKEQLADEVLRLIKESGVEKNKILGVGISVSGVVDIENQVIQTASLLGITSPLYCKELLRDLSEKLGLDVIIENDMNAAVFAEKVVRKLDDSDDIVFCSLSAGYGAGIILDGKLRRGAHNFAGEVGYMAFDKTFRVSKYKGGWLENKLKSEMSSQPETEEEMDNIAADIALSIANIYAVLDVDLFVLGGDFAIRNGALLIEKVNEYLKKFCLFDVSCVLQRTREPKLIGVASIVLEKNLTQWMG